MKPTMFKSVVGAALAAALAAVAVPASAAYMTEPVGTVDDATATSFGRIADAVLTQRTAALLDNQRQSARRLAPLADRNVLLSAGQTKTEGKALSSLRDRKARLHALGEAYTDADTRVAVDRIRVKGERATARATETTTLTYKKIRGNEPKTTGFQAHHKLTFAATADGKWQLIGVRSTDDGPMAVNEPDTVAVKKATAAPSATPAATSVPSRQQQKPAGAYDYAAMAAYAEKYWASYNPAYRDFHHTGGDCTNFVSQAMKAGGWATKGGADDDYHTWWYDSSNQSTSWVGANEWSWFTLDSKRATNLSNVYYLGVGDVLQMDFDRDGSKDHTMIVTYRSSSGVPYLTYHSVNTYRKSVASIIASYPNSLYYAYRT